MSEHLYVLRITPRATWEHPEFVGPLPYGEASALGERLWTEMGRSYEIGQLVTESELPGLWLEGARAAFAEALETREMI